MHRTRIALSVSSCLLALFAFGCAAEELPPGRDPAESGAVMGPHQDSKAHGKRGDMTDLEIIAKDKARIRSEAEGKLQIPAVNHKQPAASVCGADRYAPGGNGWLDCSTGRAVASDDTELRTWLGAQQNAAPPPAVATPPAAAAPATE